MANREQGTCPVNPVYYILNMDAQDRQDNQDETLWHRVRTRLLEVTHEPGSVLGGIRVGTWAMVELKELNPPAKKSCLSCTSM